MDKTLSLFFKPRGVALIGASANSSKLSFGILRNLLQFGYPGGVYPVNPHYAEILGAKTYPDIASVPDPVDLAVTVISSNQTPAVLEACGLRGVRAVIVISGGFKEVGARGAELESECLRIARSYSMRMIGPNCVGTLDLTSGLDTTFINGVPARGGIGFISQSGAVAGGIVDMIADKHIGFSAFASLGNEADVTETDLIEYLAEDPNTAVIAAYIEGIRDGRRFMEVASRVTHRKPIVMLKAGRSSAGARAVSSHTGSLAGSSAAYQAAFRQAGVIVVDTVVELFEVALALDCQPLPSGRRVAIATNAGGPAALASDSLSAAGLTLDALTEKTKQVLRHQLNPSAQVTNPVDMLGGAEPREYLVAIQKLLADPNVDAALAIHVPQALVEPAQVAEAIAEAQKSVPNKPVIACFMGDRSLDPARKVCYDRRIPMYSSPESVGRVLGAMCDWAEWLKKSAAPLETPGHINRLKASLALPTVNQVHALGELLTRPLLEAYGIPLVAGDFATSPDEAVQVADKTGYPVVMKIVSPDILHKSDSGGIRLGLQNAAAVRAAYDDLILSLGTAQPGLRLEGALVEAMAPAGTEVIVGIKRDPTFGPLVMFGLGGVWVELFGDVSFRVAPITRLDAVEMIRQTRAGRLLTGFRGSPPADVDAVVDVILRLCQLVHDFPEIQEIEVNPLRVFAAGQGALALDSRAILE